MDTRFDVIPLSSGADRGKKKEKKVFVDLESDSSEPGLVNAGGDDDDDDDDDDEVEDMEATLRQNALLLSDNDEDDDEDEVVGGGDQKWGKNKFTFYQEKEEDSSSSDERLHEEEAVRIEAQKLAQMKTSDFFNLPEEEEATSKTKKIKKIKNKKGSKAEEEQVVVEHIGSGSKGKDKELAALTADLRAKVKELRETVQPLLQKAEAGEIETSSGLAFMELKNVLLLNYCLNLQFYLLLKAEGRPVKDHPVIEELVRLRLLLEKTKPIDDKLRPQVNRMLKTAALGLDSVTNDPAMLRANPKQMMLGLSTKKDGKVTQAEADEDRVAIEEQVYKAPRATSMFFDKDESKAAKRERREQRLKERAAKSSVMQMVREEFGEGPEERGTGLGVIDVAEEEREMQREIQEFEEDNFIRLRPTKAQKKAGKREFVDELKSLDDFGDMERALKTARYRGGAAGAGGEGEELAGEGTLSKMAKRLRETQGGDLAVDPGVQREDSRLVSQRDREGEQVYDEFLESSKKKRDDNRKQKYDKNPNARRKSVQVEVNDEDGGKRSISQRMEVNRGLSMQRKKDIARVKHKKKFKNAEKKRAGMTRTIRKEDKRYGGETSGINSNVIRSTKL
jgi:hypothetical protein